MNDTIPSMSALTPPPRVEADTRRAHNIALRVLRMAHRMADRPAIIWPRRRWIGCGGKYARWTFARLASEIERCAKQLAQFGLKPGTRTVVLVPPGPKFFAVMFALFRINAVPVLIDPGMGRRWAAHCLASVHAEAFVGSPIAHLVRLLAPDVFRDTRVCVTLGRRWFWGGHRLCFGPPDHDAPNPSARPVGEPDDTIDAATGDIAPDAPAAILFTSGSTGPPKGVIYTHATFNAQVDLLASTFGLRPGQIDVATFPPFALFDAALGITAVIPRMDPTRPGFCDPRAIIDAVNDHAATNLFGSPALLDRVATYHRYFPSPLPTLRRVLTAGAPVRPDILSRLRGMLPGEAVIYTPYGATEALPVTAITDREILCDTAQTTARGGVCVGRPVEGADVHIIRIDDGPVASWSNVRRLPAGEIGEIVVRGPMVTAAYYENERGNELAKIADGTQVWHRMGDVGYFDEQGRLWMCGRKSHRVITPHGVLFTEPVEAIFNQHPAVRRTALVGVGAAPKQRPVLCVERRRFRRRSARWLSHIPPRRRRGEPAHGFEPVCNAVSGPADKSGRVANPIARSDGDVRADLLEIARSNPMTRLIDTVLFHRRFPVDIRHNAKIFREQLAAWAERRLRGG